MRHLLAIFVAMLCAHDAIGGVSIDKRIDTARSAGLFVGVRQFDADSALQELPYAVDDAVDLAYAMSMNSPSRLLEPAGVILALSGEPSKEISKKRLAALLAAGALRRGAGQSEILDLLETQAHAVSGWGILVVSFATHGMSDAGTQYLLTSTSRLQYRETTLSETRICDIIYEAHVDRSLVFIDACRQKLLKGPRATPDPRSAAALLSALARMYGHVVFSAAAAGDYAYDDDQIGNGVFTAAVIDGLECAATSRRGYVTVETLSEYVARRVLQWVRKNRRSDARKATQIQYELQAKRMPLSVCPAGVRKTH